MLYEQIADVHTTGKSHVTPLRVIRQKEQESNTHLCALLATRVEHNPNIFNHMFKIL